MQVKMQKIISVSIKNREELKKSISARKQLCIMR